MSKESRWSPCEVCGLTKGGGPGEFFRVARAGDKAWAGEPKFMYARICGSCRKTPAGQAMAQAWNKEADKLAAWNAGHGG